MKMKLELDENSITLVANECAEILLNKILNIISNQENYKALEELAGKYAKSAVNEYAVKNGAYETVNEMMKNYTKGNIKSILKEEVNNALSQPQVRKMTREYIVEIILEQAENYRDRD